MSPLRVDTLEHASPVVADAIRTLVGEAYGIEADILGVADFLPLRRSAADIAQAGTTFIGVRLDGGLAAVAELEDQPSGRCRICSLVVSPARFRTGLATALMREIMRARPARDLTVSTGVRNAPALRLYAAHGFREQDRWSTPDGIPMVTLVREGGSRPDTAPAAPTIRPATHADFERILRLNSDWEHVTSPLDGPALTALHDAAAYHRVVELGSRIAAFLLALGPGRLYGSPNYRWFDTRATDFLYIDRVIVSSDFHRSGLGAALYDDVRAFAASQGIGRLVCEVDAEPLNAASDAFHRRRGFVEVGTQWVADGTKRVSLRECSVMPEASE